MAVTYSNMATSDTKIFAKYLKTHLNKQINTKKPIGKAFQMPLRAIKYQLTCQFTLTSVSSLIGRKAFW